MHLMHDRMRKAPENERLLSPVQSLLEICKQPVELILRVWQEVKLIVDQLRCGQVCVVAPYGILGHVCVHAVKQQHCIHRKRTLTCHFNSLLLQQGHRSVKGSHIYLLQLILEPR